MDVLWLSSERICPCVGWRQIHYSSFLLSSWHRQSLPNYRWRYLFRTLILKDPRLNPVLFQILPLHWGRLQISLAYVILGDLSIHPPKSFHFSPMSILHILEWTFFFVDSRLLHWVTSSDYHSIVISDHAPASFVIHFPNHRSPHKQWKLSHFSLYNPYYKKLFQEEIGNFFR